MTRLRESVTTVSIADDADSAPVAAPAPGAYPNGFNLLIVGSDTGEGQGALGTGRDTELNDVNLLVHVSADHDEAAVVSIPRDLVVPVPTCTDDGVARPAQLAAALNTTLAAGGLPCTVRTVEALTGLDIQFASLVTFAGVIRMSDAVGGVPVCLATGIDDEYTGFTRAAGTHVLSGGDALAFLRSRHGVGDGGDLTRISAQQVFLSSLVRTLSSERVTDDAIATLRLAQAAVDNMLLSTELADPDTMAAVINALGSVAPERFTFVQYPGMTGMDGVYEGKVAPIQAQAAALFEAIEADDPFRLAAVGDGRGSVADPGVAVASVSASAGDVLVGLRGQTAADQTCAVGR